MNMMRFNEGGMTSEMLQQAMEAQAANMGQDITGDSFILTGQYSSPVQQEEDGREYVEYQHPDMQEPVKVYGNWNEYAVSQDENGMMLIGDEDYPIMQDEEGNYMLNEQKFDDQMTAMTERQGAEAMAREAAQGSTQGASQMENLMEMLQDAQGPQGEGGQYEEGGEIPEYFLGGLMGKSNKMMSGMREKMRGSGLLGMSGIGLAKNLINRIRDRRGGNAQAQAAQATQIDQGAADQGVRMVKGSPGNPAQIASTVAGAAGPKGTITPNPAQQATNAVQQAAALNPRVRTSFEEGGQVKEYFAGGMLGLQNMRDQNTEFMAQQEASRQQRMAAYQATGGGNQVSPALQQSLAATGGQITTADGSTMNVAVPGAAAAPAPAPTGQVPVQDPNAAVTNQAAMMAQPQPGVAQMGMGVMQDGGRVIKAYEEGGDVQGLLAMLDAMPSKPQISHEDIYKKYLKSRDKGSYMQQEGVADIIKEQERIFEQRGNKFSDGTGYRDLFEYGGKMDEYAYGGKVVKAYENGGKGDEIEGEEFERQDKFMGDNATDVLLSRLGEMKTDRENQIEGRLTDKQGNPITEKEYRRMVQENLEIARQNLSSKDKSTIEAYRIAKAEADNMPEYTQSEESAGSNIFGDVRGIKEVNQRLDKESHWFDPNDKRFGEGGFDVSNPAHVIIYQKMYNHLAPDSEQIKVDGKWGEQTQSAHITMRRDPDAPKEGVDPELEMRLFEDRPEGGDWDGGDGGGGGGGGGGKKKKKKKNRRTVVQFLDDTIGEVCEGGHCSQNWEEGGRVIKYDKGGKFPDLNKDGKITMADILKGRGVKSKYRQGGRVMKYKC